jgi:hypothetical protein
MTLPGDVPPVEVLRGLGLFTMALLLGLRLVPGLRARQRQIGIAALVVYFGGALVVLAVGYLL